MIHIGKKHFACEYLEKKFIRSTNIREHERIPICEKFCTCEYCDSQEFTRKSQQKQITISNT